MGKTYVLDRVAADLARGLTHPAIQRLSSLVHAYPTDLDLRRRLAAAHRRVGNHVQAGRWDYLTIGADAADTAAFERAFPSPVERLRAVRWPHRASAAATSYARSRLAKLTAAAQAMSSPARGARARARAMSAPDRGSAARAVSSPAGAARAMSSPAGAAPGTQAATDRMSRRRAPARLPRTLTPRFAIPLAVAVVAAAALVSIGVATVIEWIVR